MGFGFLCFFVFGLASGKDIPMVMSLLYRILREVNGTCLIVWWSLDIGNQRAGFTPCNISSFTWLERASGSEEVKWDAVREDWEKTERRLWHWKTLRRRRVWRHIRDIDIEEDMKREVVMESLQDPHSEFTITMSSVFLYTGKYLTHIGWWLRRKFPAES